jgi:hypothetical protein
MSKNSGVEFGVSVSSTNSLLTVKDSRFVLNRGTVRRSFLPPHLTLEAMQKSLLTIHRTPCDVYPTGLHRS